MSDEPRLECEHAWVWESESYDSWDGDGWDVYRCERCGAKAERYVSR